MKQVTAALRLRTREWAHLLLSAALLGALVFACLPAQLAPAPGTRELSAFARVPVPGGHVNAAGGNYFHERVDLALDTRLGPLSIGAAYNSSGGWISSVDVTYQNGTLRDATGAVFAMSALASGDAAPGSHWVKVDATRVKTKGGLLHEFDGATGRLLAIRWTSSAYPRLRFPQSVLAGSWRTSAVEQCTSATVCAAVFTLGYDASGRLARVDDRAGRSALLTYDAAGKLASARDGLDVAKGWPGERYAYTGDFLASITSSEGERIEIASDAQGRALEVRALGGGDPTFRFAYGRPDATGVATTTVTDPLGNASVFAIDVSARVLSIANALGERTQLSWSGLRPASLTLPDGSRTSWTWANDDLASETLPSGNVRAFTYQASAVDRERSLERPLLELNDSLGLVERRSYDASGRLVSQTNGAGETTTFAYAADESVALVTRPDGVLLYSSSVGEHGKATQLSNDGSSWLSQSFDAVGNATESALPGPYSGGVTRAAYDADRNLVEIGVVDQPMAPATPAPGSVRLEFRSDHQPTRVRQPLGGETVFVYDALGRLSERRERVSPTATPAPDSWSTTRFGYDAAGRLAFYELANGMRTEQSYDAAGRVRALRRLLAGSATTELSFGFARGQLVSAVSADRELDESYAYDAAGRLSEVRHTLGESTRFTRDARSRLTQTELRMPSGIALAALSARYDGADRQVELTALGQTLVTRTLVAGRLRTETYANGLTRQTERSTKRGRVAAWDLLRGATRLERSDHTQGSALGAALEGSHTVISNAGALNTELTQTYRYAGVAQPAGADRRLAEMIAPSGFAEQLSFDALSNLVEWRSTANYLFGTIPVSRTLTFNAERNRVLATRVRSVLDTTWVHAYDAAGFETSRSLQVGSQAQAIEASFRWNAAGQLVAVTAAGRVEASLSYDALGRRRSLSANGNVRRWRFGGAVETNADDAPVAIDLGPVRIALDGQHRFRHGDERGNVRLVSNMSGQLETLTRYGAFGASSTLGGTAPDVGFANGAHLQTSAGELVLLGARPLDPSLGRFLSPDPLWNPLNLYAYTFGNPIEFLDESGLHPGHSGGLDDHQAIELKRIERNAAVALTVVFAGVAAVTKNPAAIGAAIAAAVVAIQKHLELRTLEKFHELSFPVVIDPVLAAPPSIGPFEIPDVGWFGGGFGEGSVTICDDPDINPC